MADAEVSKTFVETRESSNLSSGTSNDQASPSMGSPVLRMGAIVRQAMHPLSTNDSPWDVRCLVCGVVAVRAGRRGAAHFPVFAPRPPGVVPPDDALPRYPATPANSRHNIRDVRRRLAKYPRCAPALPAYPAIRRPRTAHFADIMPRKHRGGRIPEKCAVSGRRPRRDIGDVRCWAGWPPTASARRQPLPLAVPFRCPPPAAPICQKKRPRKGPFLYECVLRWGL